MHQLVLVAEESEDALMLSLVRGMGKVQLRGSTVLLHHLLIHIELLHAVLPGILKLLLARQAVLLHGVGNLEGGVDADAVEAVELFGVHAAHGGAENQVGLLLLANLI